MQIAAPLREQIRIDFVVLYMKQRIKINTVFSSETLTELSGTLQITNVNSNET